MYAEQFKICLHRCSNAFNYSVNVNFFIEEKKISYLIGNFNVLLVNEIEKA